MRKQTKKRKAGGIRANQHRAKTSPGKTSLKTEIADRQIKTDLLKQKLRQLRDKTLEAQPTYLHAKPRQRISDEADRELYINAVLRDKKEKRKAKQKAAEEKIAHDIEAVKNTAIGEVRAAERAIEADIRRETADLKREIKAETGDIRREIKDVKLLTAPAPAKPALTSGIPLSPPVMRKYKYKGPAQVVEEKGKGKNGGAGGMTGEEIEKLASGIPGFLGVYMADWNPREVYDRMIKSHSDVYSFIMNMDKTGKSGSHWVAVYIDPDKDKSIEYYNSFGEGPTADFSERMRELVHLIQPSTMLRYKNNGVPEQSARSDTCGWFAVKFLHDRTHGRGFRDVTGYGLSENIIKKFRKKFVDI